MLQAYQCICIRHESDIPAAQASLNCSSQAPPGPRTDVHIVTDTPSSSLSKCPLHSGYCHQFRIVEARTMVRTSSASSQHLCAPAPSGIPNIDIVGINVTADDQTSRRVADLHISVLCKWLRLTPHTQRSRDYHTRQLVQHPGIATPLARLTPNINLDAL